MAKGKNTTNIVLVVLIFAAIFIFGGAFWAGYFYKDRVFDLIGPRISIPDEESRPDKNGNAQELLMDDLPDGFPSDFPIYPNAALSDSWTASGNSTEGISVIWLTDDSPKDVSSFFQENLPDSSWGVFLQSEEDAFTTISFEKGNTSGFVGITKGEGGKTVISVTMGVSSK